MPYLVLLKDSRNSREVGVIRDTLGNLISYEYLEDASKAGIGCIQQFPTFLFTIVDLTRLKWGRG